MVCLGWLAGDAAGAVPPAETWGNLGFSPARIAVAPAGTACVTSPGTREIVVFDPSGAVIERFTPSVTLVPLGIALLPGGDIAVTDLERGAVDIYDSARAYVRSLGAGAGEFDQPNDLAFEPQSGNLYVVDAQQHQVAVYSAAGSLLNTFGSQGSATGQFFYPISLTLMPGGGELYVADQANFRVQVFDLNGAYVRSFGSRGLFPGQFTRPQGVAADRTGAIFVADAYADHVQVLDGVTGAYQVQLGDIGLVPGVGLQQPMGMALDIPRLRLLVASHSSQSIEVFDLTGILPYPAAVPGWPCF